MAFIATDSPLDAQGDVRAMYARQQSKYGYVPNYAKVFCHRPEIMGLWAELQKGIRRHIEPRRFELVTFAAAHALRNTYCSLAHGMALTKFFPPDAVRAIAGDPRRAALTPAEAAMVEFARKVAVDAAAVTAEDVAALERHGFTDAEIFDIAAAAAARAFFTKLLDGLGAEPDASLSAIEAELGVAVRGGRPVDGGEPERLHEG